MQRNVYSIEFQDFERFSKLLLSSWAITYTLLKYLLHVMIMYPISEKNVSSSISSFICFLLKLKRGYYQGLLITESNYRHHYIILKLNMVCRL